MLLELNKILIYWLITFFIGFLLYPVYIKLLIKYKAWKTIRENDVSWNKAEIFNQMHQHKAWTPTMWGGLIMLVLIIMISVSYILQLNWIITYSLITRQETYILLFAFFWMWFVGLIDDILNIKWSWKAKWLSAWVKLFFLFWFAWFVSYFFYHKLGQNSINLWPFMIKLDLWIIYPIFTFIFTISIVNAINLTDGLDWLAGWLMLFILWIFSILTFYYKRYIATTVIAIIIALLFAFLRYNINPAKIFMWDSWALWLWGILSTLVYLLNIKLWILIPFMILFLIFWVELLSSFLQILSKRFLWRKLFKIAPFHHLLEYYWLKETNIVMKFWLIQWVLSIVTLILIFYQIN